MSYDDESSVGIVHFSSDGECLWANPKSQEILGYSFDELVNKTFREIIPPDGLQQVLDFSHRLWIGKKGPFSLVTRFIRKDDSTISVSLSVWLACKPSGDPDYLKALLEELPAERITWE